MELALLWLVFAVFAMIGATQKNRLGRRMVLCRVAAWPVRTIGLPDAESQIPDIEEYAAREEYERKSRDGMDMSKLSSSRSDSG